MATSKVRHGYVFKSETKTLKEMFSGFKKKQIFIY